MKNTKIKFTVSVTTFPITTSVYNDRKSFKNDGCYKHESKTPLYFKVIKTETAKNNSKRTGEISTQHVVP